MNVIILTTLAFLIILCGCGSDRHPRKWSVYQKGLSDSMLGYRAQVESTLIYDEDHQTEFTEWVVPDDCDVSLRNSTVATLTCPRGIHAISAELVETDDNSTVSDTRNFRFVDDPYCYQWYGYINNSDPGNVSLMLWIVDLQQQEVEEERRIASLPSTNSVQLSNMFHARGLQPSIREILPEPREELEWGHFSFGREGYWTTSLNTAQKLQYLLRVNENIGLTVNGCFVKSTDILIALPKYILDTPSEDDVQLIGQGISTCQDPCALHVAVAIRGDVLFTQDGFKTTTLLYVLSSLIEENDALTDCAFTADKLYLLFQSGRLIHLSTAGEFTQVQGVENFNITSIRGKSACLPPVSTDPIEITLAWNKEHLFLIEGENTLTEVPFPTNLIQVTEEYDQGSTAYMMDAAFNTDATSITVILRINDSAEDSSAVAFLSYLITENDWQLLPFWMEDPSSQTLNVIEYLGGIDDIIFWNTNMLFYSELKGQSRGVFSVVDQLDQTINLTESDTIDTVVVCGNEDIFVHMTSGALYYGSMEDKLLAEISSLKNGSFLFCDFSGSAYSVQYTNSTDTEVELITKNVNLITALYPSQHDHTCKVIQFERMSGLKSIYYLDRKETLYLWAKLTHRSTVYNDIKVSVSTTDFLDVEKSDNTAHSRGRRSVNMTIAIHSVAILNTSDHNTTSNETTGIITVQMKPLKTGLGCISRKPMVTYVSVGCPPGRHIIVGKPAECDISESFSLSSGAYVDGNEATTNGNEVTQNEFGCPLLGTHGSTLKPSVHLYDDDDYIEEVSVDYILYELQNRTDFTYSATQGMVGCRSAAQTWARMKESSDDDSPAAWGPHNYIPCFRNDGTSSASSLSQRYEVLNKTGQSALQWEKTDDDQLYQFYLKVIDPNYSFCLLETKFAVVVQGSAVGVEPNSNVTIYVLIAFALVTFSIGFASYILFRDKHMEEWKRNQAFEEDEDMAFDDDGEELTEKEEERMAMRQQQRRNTIRSLTGDLG